jgi:hypothetical protein
LVFGPVAFPAGAQGPLFNPYRSNASAPIQDLVIADFNNDGRPDGAALVDGFPTKSINVWVNGPNGLPIAAANQFITTGPDARSIAAGDYDANGNVDLFVYDVTGGPTSVRLVLGDGTGGFSYSGAFPIGHGGYDIAAADVNADGRADLAMAATKELMILVSTQFGYSGTQTHVMTTLNNLPGVRVGYGDLDNDGNLDIVCCNSGGGTSNARAYRNSGSGIFTFVNEVHFDSTLFDLALGDLDGDGRADAAVTLGTAQELRWLPGTAAAGLGASQIVTGLISSTVSVAIADLNHNSVREICYSDGTLHAFEYAGGGSFNLSMVSPSGFGSTMLRIADANGDGHQDYWTPFNSVSGPSRLSILLGDGVGGASSISTSSSGMVRSLEAVDWNGDGYLDLMTTSNDSLVAYTGNGWTFTSASSLFVTSGVFPPAIADFNLDGNADCVAPGASGSNGVLFTSLGDGAGNFGAPTQTIVQNGYIPYRVVAGDFNADGKPDAVSTDAYQSKVHFSPGDGLGGFGSPPAALAMLGQVWGVAAGDFNGDGILDIAASMDVRVTTYLGQPGGPVYGATTNDSAGSFAEIAAGDVNGDGLADIVVTSSSASNYYKSNGDGSFTKLASLGVATNDTALIRDINRDGLVDITIPDTGDGVMAVFLSTHGGIQAANSIQYLPSSYVGHTTFGDFDADGNIDAARGLETGSIVLALGVAGGEIGAAAFGGGTPGCNGKHGILSNVPPAVGGPNFGVSCTNALSSALGILLYANATNIPGADIFGIGVAIHVDPFAATEFGAVDLHSDAGGVGFAPIPIPNNPSLHGLTYGVQGVFLWQPGTRCLPTMFGLSSTPGLALTIP